VAVVVVALIALALVVCCYYKHRRGRKQNQVKIHSLSKPTDGPDDGESMIDWEKNNLPSNLQRRDGKPHSLSTIQNSF